MFFHWTGALIGLYYIYNIFVFILHTKWCYDVLVFTKKMEFDDNLYKNLKIHIQINYGFPVLLSVKKPRKTKTCPIPTNKIIIDCPSDQ